MKRMVTVMIGALALIALASSAFAALRVPQVVVNGGGLQGYLNGQGETINVLTDQEDAQRWLSSASNNNTFTMMVELAGNAASNTIGLYNAAFVAPPLYQVFPGAATTGWFAVANWRTGPTRVIVQLFDASSTFQGSTTYLAGPPDKNDFGFYLQGPCNTFYTQDARNPGGLAQALAYKGTGINSGSWWLAWEDLDTACGSDYDFDDCVLFLESVNPTPVSKTSWGSLKARFR